MRTVSDGWILAWMHVIPCKSRRFKHPASHPSSIAHRIKEQPRQLRAYPQGYPGSFGDRRLLSPRLGRRWWLIRQRQMRRMRDDLQIIELNPPFPMQRERQPKLAILGDFTKQFEALPTLGRRPAQPRGEPHEIIMHRGAVPFR